MMMRVTPTKTIAPEIPNPIFSESTGFWWQSERKKIKIKVALLNPFLKYSTVLLKTYMKR